MKKFYVYSIEEIEVDEETLTQKSEQMEFDDYKMAVRELIRLKSSTDQQIIGYNYISVNGRMQRDIIKRLPDGSFEFNGIEDLPQDNKLEELVDYFM